MEEKKHNTTPVRSSASAKKRPAKRSRRKPTSAEIEASQATQAAHKAALDSEDLGRVVGLDEDWIPFVIDLTLPAGHVAKYRGRAEMLGFTRDDEATVAGVSNSEVWIMPRSVYESTIKADRIARDAANRKAWKVD
jgi:hypothetical protein